MTSPLLVLALLAAAPSKLPYEGPTGGLRVAVKKMGAPVAGSELSVTCFAQDKSGKTQFVHGKRQQTDARGEASWLDLPSGVECSVSIEKGPNQSWQLKTTLREGIESVVEQVLPELSVIAGRAVDTAGNPIIADIGAPARQLDGTPISGFTRRCGNDGRFELEYNQPGEHELIFTEKWSGTAARVMATAPSADLVVTMQKGAVVTGRVRDGRGPVKKYEVRLQTSASDVYDMRRIEDGSEYTVGLVPPGKYTLLIDADGRKLERQIEIPRGATTHREDFDVEKGAGLSGVVVDVHGRPLEGALLKVTGVGDDRKLTTGPDGRFELESLTGDCWLRAERDGFVPRGSTLVKPTGQTVTLVLDAVGRARGRLVDAKGQPVREFTLGGKGFSSDAGAFEVEVRRNEQLVELSVPGQGAAIDVLKGSRLAETVDVGTLVWKPGGEVAVTVISELTERPELMGLVGYAQRTNGQLEFISSGRLIEPDGRGQVRLPVVRVPGVLVTTGFDPDVAEVPPGAASVVLKRPSPFNRR